jgi:oxalate decarboxylase/phosphoglucose isomerase-like protein (cupin superfamily)
MKRTLLLFALLALAAGCAHLDYVGESYPRTQDVALFYSESNVGRPYRQIGELVATSESFLSTHKVQDKIVEKAREKGADAVIILGLERIKTGESTDYNETTTEHKGKKGKEYTTTSGGSTTTVHEQNRIRAIFVKYTGEKPAE